jgi:hypothetical protein
LGADKYDTETGRDDRTQEQVQLTEDLCNAMADRFNRFHDDFRFKDGVILTVSSLNSDDTMDFYQTQSSILKKVFNSWLEKGPLYIKMHNNGSLDFWGGPAENSKVWLRQEVRTSTKMGVRIRSPFNFMKYLFETADKKDFKAQASIEAIENAGGFTTGSKIFLKSASGLVEGLSTNQITLGMFRPGAKYVNKKITPEGRVKYLYRKGDLKREPHEEEEGIKDPKGKKKEKTPQKRENFRVKIDSSEKSYRAMFEQACAEIPEDFFDNIHAGVSAIRITQDSETFFDFLGASDNQRNNAEFGAASGTYNVSKGKMAFNVSKFPDGLSEILKKRNMLHEVGHAWFFGTMRMKENKPMTAEGFKDLDKAYVKSSTKFIDQFGKLDKDIRKTVDEEVSQFKGDQKIEAMISKMTAVFVDYYAAKDNIEHFAQAFSYYFILPEMLKQKEPDVYKHFNEFFGKYKG